MHNQCVWMQFLKNSLLTWCLTIEVIHKCNSKHHQLYIGGMWHGVGSYYGYGFDHRVEWVNDKLRMIIYVLFQPSRWVCGILEFIGSNLIPHNQNPSTKHTQTLIITLESWCNMFLILQGSLCSWHYLSFFFGGFAVNNQPTQLAKEKKVLQKISRCLS